MSSSIQAGRLAAQRMPLKHTLICTAGVSRRKRRAFLRLINAIDSHPSPQTKKYLRRGREEGRENVGDAASHYAQHVDNGERNHEEHKACSEWVGDEDERQNEHRSEAEPKALVQLPVDDLERFPLQIPVVLTDGGKGKQRGT